MPESLSAARPGFTARVMLVVLRAYQLLLSPLFGANCRYLPTCSAYACDAVRLHGAWRGGWMALKRIGRCHPWGRHGYDPVPPAHRSHD